MHSLRLICPLLLIASASAEARASAPPSSPFAPGGPLAPWTGPAPAPPSQPPARAGQEPPSPSAPGAPSDTFRVPSSPAPVDRDWKPLGAEDRPSTYVSAFVNPVLMKYGKFTTHLELAPYGPHALFLEVSRLSLEIKDTEFGVQYSAQVKGWEYDFGYHLFPLSRGARGFYMGPRYVRGSGSAEGASGKFTGWGFDLGYQFVVADHLVFNLGAGFMHVSGSAQLDPTVLSKINVPPGSTSGFESLTSGSGSYLLPLVTLGVGLAI